MFAMFFLGALYMQRILGYDALQVGLAYLPLTIVMGTMSFRFTGQLNLKYGPEATLVPAMIFVVAGLLWLARTPVDANYVIDLLPSMILIGLGAGLGFPSLMTIAMSGTTESDSGLASGLVNTSVQVGGAIGLAVLATFATERTDGLLADGEPAAEALNSGYHLAYLIGAGLVLGAIAVAFTTLRVRIPELAPEPAAEPVAEPVPAATGEPSVAVAAATAERPAITARPLPRSAANPCEEAGIRVTIGCGGGAGSAPQGP
jgi:MFS family permease